MNGWSKGKVDFVRECMKIEIRIHIWIVQKFLRLSAIDIYISNTFPSWPIRVLLSNFSGCFAKNSSIFKLFVMNTWNFWHYKWKFLNFLSSFPVYFAENFGKTFGFFPDLHLAIQNEPVCEKKNGSYDTIFKTKNAFSFCSSTFVHLKFGSHTPILCVVKISIFFYDDDTSIIRSCTFNSQIVQLQNVLSIYFDDI